MRIFCYTHTSPVQIRTMLKQKPPIKIICPGRVYRSDAVDATHSPIFHQIEGLVVDKNITMKRPKRGIGCFRQEGIRAENPNQIPSPSFSLHRAQCRGGRNLRHLPRRRLPHVHTGWIEILGAGMVHPNVLSYCNIDPEE